MSGTISRFKEINGNHFEIERKKLDSGNEKVTLIPKFIDIKGNLHEDYKEFEDLTIQIEVESSKTLYTKPNLLKFGTIKNFSHPNDTEVKKNASLTLGLINIDTNKYEFKKNIAKGTQPLIETVFKDPVAPKNDLFKLDYKDQEIVRLHINRKYDESNIHEITFIEKLFSSNIARQVLNEIFFAQLQTSDYEINEIWIKNWLNFSGSLHSDNKFTVNPFIEDIIEYFNNSKNDNESDHDPFEIIENRQKINEFIDNVCEFVSNDKKILKNFIEISKE